MYILLTVDNMYYNGILNTYATHKEAYEAGCKLSGWWDIQEIL